ncbi:camphor resistance protein CrcB [Sphingomonas sp. Leaf10]|nr:CrcB family protein [Sphingomonas sp. Leaf10]KQM30064.1 camphor resistance protein CrcB [Sphingomonas sp. Leaf10]
MGNIFIVMAGGALGSGLRYSFGRLATAAFGADYPWGTLGVNLLGGLAMGLLMGALSRSGGGSEAARLAIGVGLLGGFTTFSAFSLDMVTMLERGAMGSAIGYALASVVGAGVALFVGLQLTRGAAA